MSEYKENTVGWWLSQLKEPLKSRALGITEDHAKPCGSLEDAIAEVLKCLVVDSTMWTYWRGVFVYYFGGFHIDSQNFKDGFDLAHECDPWREDKAIVDSPKKTRELFFYADETLINPLRNPFKEPLVIYPRGEMNSVIVEEDKIRELMNANPSITFWPTNVGGVSPEKPESWMDGEIRKYRDNIEKVLTFDADSPAPEIPVTEDSGSLADFHFPRIVKSDALPPNHFAGIGDDGNPFIGELSTGIITPALEIEAPERAVVGYEEPKPIDTIEKKHELRIKNLEARVKQLEDQLFKYLGSKNG